MLNPWSEPPGSPVEWIPRVYLPLGLKEETYYLFVGLAILALEWDMVCESFESLYVNWDPAQFQHHTVFHGYVLNRVRACIYKLASPSFFLASGDAVT